MTGIKSKTQNRMLIYCIWTSTLLEFNFTHDNNMLQNILHQIT